MMIQVVKSKGNPKCRGFDCNQLPEHINPNGRIIKGTLVAKITVNSSVGYSEPIYCRDCIDQIYQTVREKLNSKIWIFE